MRLLQRDVTLIYNKLKVRITRSELWNLVTHLIYLSYNRTVVSLYNNQLCVFISDSDIFPDFIHLLSELARKANKIKGSFCFCLCSA